MGRQYLLNDLNRICVVVGLTITNLSAYFDCWIALSKTSLAAKVPTSIKDSNPMNALTHSFLMAVAFDCKAGMRASCEMAMMPDQRL